MGFSLSPCILKQFSYFFSHFNFEKNLEIGALPPKARKIRKQFFETGEKNLNISKVSKISKFKQISVILQDSSWKSGVLRTQTLEK
jgi:hypothetical protein